MNLPLFSEAEWKELSAHFERFPVSRIWVSETTSGLRFEGFLTNTEVAQPDLVVLMNGEPIEDVHWHGWAGLDDPALDPDPLGFRVFRWWPQKSGFGFSAHVEFDRLEKAAAESGEVRIWIADRAGHELCARSQAVYLPADDLKSRLSGTQPPEHLVARVAGRANAAEWFLSGYTNLRVIDEVMTAVMGDGFGTPGPVLEWGCGCGRLTRHLLRRGLSVTGIDIDGESVQWCNENLTKLATGEGRFLQCPLLPPTDLPSESFGSAIGISVITHLNSEAGEFWLRELARLIRRGGILVLTKHGFDTFSIVSDARIFRGLAQDGFFSQGSTHLDAVLGSSQSYYRETWHSDEFVRKTWTEYFDVVAIERGGHFGYQDTVVLRRNEDRIR